MTALDREARARVIGGSESAAALGLSPFMTKAELFDLKTGLIESDPDNAETRRGRELEPVAIARYQSEAGRVVTRMKHRTNLDLPFIGCTVDGSIKSIGQIGPGVLEVKCPRMARFVKVKYEGPPEHEIIQLVHNLIATGRKWGSLAYYSGELSELRKFDFIRSTVPEKHVPEASFMRIDEKMVTAIIEGVRAFVFDYWQAGVRPPDALNPALETPSGSGEAELRNDEEWKHAAADYIEAAELATTASKLKDEARDRVQLLAGHLPCVQGAGIRATTTPGRSSLDTKKLKQDHPDLDLTPYMKQGRPIFTIRLTKREVEEHDDTDNGD